ncbi:hypothetical protein F511_17137 [Dorcoceras hygrometricum]|uniref:Uncharacterized protein n=1 Tax=Dorcoceras hygrometricum TaxID=472368 RepID=A0A2Z7BDT2_9LAMI|nr:hypothetical protein F511_17137 [Dorcoceras hygrometricum]
MTQATLITPGTRHKEEGGCSPRQPEAFNPSPDPTQYNGYSQTARRSQRTTQRPPKAQQPYTGSLVTTGNAPLSTTVTTLLTEIPNSQDATLHVAETEAQSRRRRSLSQSPTAELKRKKGQ